MPPQPRRVRADSQPSIFAILSCGKSESTITAILCVRRSQRFPADYGRAINERQNYADGRLQKTGYP